MARKKHSQLDLFSPKTQKIIALQAVLDRIKKDFGEKAVFTGTQIPDRAPASPKKTNRP